MVSYRFTLLIYKGQHNFPFWLNNKTIYEYSEHDFKPIPQLF